MSATDVSGVPTWALISAMLNNAIDCSGSTEPVSDEEAATIWSKALENGSPMLEHVGSRQLFFDPSGPMVDFTMYDALNLGTTPSQQIVSQLKSKHTVISPAAPNLDVYSELSTHISHLVAVSGKRNSAGPQGHQNPDF